MHLGVYVNNEVIGGKPKQLWAWRPQNHSMGRGEGSYASYTEGETRLQKISFTASMEISQPDLVSLERGKHLP